MNNKKEDSPLLLGLLFVVGVIVVGSYMYYGSWREDTKPIAKGARDALNHEDCGEIHGGKFCISYRGDDESETSELKNIWRFFKVVHRHVPNAEVCEYVKAHDPHFNGKYCMRRAE